jgi:hypothetical protein
VTPACKYETFKRTAHPSVSRTNVLFCVCDECTYARAVLQLGGPLKSIRPATTERFAALRWKPEPDRDDHDEETAP